MKLKTILWLVVSIFILSTISVFAQTQKFDVMTYTTPKGWTVGQNGQAKTFTTVDKSAGKFCIMMLYPSVTNHGTPSQDFAYVWKTLVRETFKAGANPEKETTQADGFTMISGGELIDYEGNKALAMLTTVSGKGRVISLLSIFNDAKYADNVQSFLGAIDIDIKEAPKTQPTTKSSGSGFSGSVSDYEFTLPPKWKAEYLQNETILKYKTDYSEFILSFQPFVASSGNLESDSERIFWQVFEGWQPSTANGFKADYGTFEKGKTIQGFSYFLVRKYIVKRFGNDDVKKEGILLLVQVGDKVAVISGSQFYQDISEGALKALDYILYDLTFNNAGQPASLQKDLLGSWSSVSSVALLYTYHPNGTFSFGGASQFRTSRDTYTDNVTTTSFSSDGTYKLTGNLMTTIHRSTKVVSKYKIRFYYTKYDKDEWQYKLGELPLDSESGGTIVFSKNK